MLFLGFLSGAKIVEIKFFERPSTGKLGYVKFIPRGNIIFKAIQCSLIGCAPVVTGIIFLYLAYFFPLNSSELSIKILFAYVIFSVVCHMSMSGSDIANYFKGSFVILPLLWAVFFMAII